MRIHHLLLPFLGATLVTAPVLAQPTQPTAASEQANADGWITQLSPDQWQASRLEGLAVYSSNNGDKIGDITSLIFNSSGKVQAVLIGVGGYLGIGERNIAVPFGQIKFVNEPRVKTIGTTTGEARLAGINPGGGTVTSPAATGTATVPAGPNSPANPNVAPSNEPAPAASGVLGQAAPARSGSSPNHAVLMMSITKDELQAAPEFRYSR